MSNCSFCRRLSEIQQSPPSPAGRGVLWTLVALLVRGDCVGVLRHVDIVAVAAGKLVPSSRVKVIQPVSIGACAPST